MKAEDNAGGDPGYCLYAAQTILPLLNALSAETDGVKASSDIEYVHRCRVATRRIRAALPLYSECFDGKSLKTWKKKIRSLTKALGEARDKDVQIDFLNKYIDGISERDFPVQKSLFAPESPVDTVKNTSETTVIVAAEPEEAAEKEKTGFFQRIITYLSNVFKKNTKSPALSDKNEPPVYFPVTNPLLPGLECLKLRLKQDRKSLQPYVIKETETLESSGIVDEMAEKLQKIIVRSKIENIDIHSPYAFEKAFYGISMKMEGLFWYERYVSDPENKRMHHEMRIAAKRLRYTMEAFSDLYDNDMKDHIKSVKRLQDLLGEIHDCDVWSEFLTQFLEQEKRRVLAFFGNMDFCNVIIPGIEHLREDRILKRKSLYDEFTEYWDELKKNNEWESVRKTISIPLQISENYIASSGKIENVKIALIGDIHANLPALKAVLADARERGAGIIINTGDFVGYGAFPEDVVSCLRKEHAISVIGNYDISVLNQKSKKKKRKNRNRYKQLAMSWAYKNLSGDSRRYLKSLPRYIRLSIEDKSLYITHGSPESIKEYIDEDTPVPRLEEFLKETGADIIVSGHTHLPFAKEINGKWFINTGSVGRPEDGDPRACYALLTVKPFSLYHVRIPYDIEKAVKGIYQNNLPDAFARIYREGKPLDIIRHAGDEQNL
ncbi:putative phosphoesterase [Methanomicrobium sp. W14]|uniref:CHAD domain-containing protein n=1 Tax=Methanomicrobium sp. W14 TaxID=2817839 RepID=UPI001AE79414|nr:CHAD domain-containing protein [Methanomicrobium sp. W14]MBP2132738.1 putative phosphoesterase [Methanomicrobium sp. W14]